MPNVEGQARAGCASPAPSTLAIRFESRVKLNNALRNTAIQRQGEEDLFRYSLMDKPPDVLEPEAPVVLRMSHEAASPGTKVLQT